MGSFEHNQSLWYRDSQQIAQVVKQPNGDPGRKDPLRKKQGQGEHRIAVITNDMPPTTMTPTFCHTGTGTFQGYGKNDSYKYLDGTRIWTQFTGPNRDCRMMSVLPAHDGPETQGSGGATGQPTLVPTVQPKGK